MITKLYRSEFLTLKSNKGTHLVLFTVAGEDVHL